MNRRPMTDSEKVLMAAYIAAFKNWATALSKEFGCCETHLLIMAMKVETMLLRFEELSNSYVNFRISTAEMTYLLTTMTNEMVTETKTLVGLESMDKALDTAILQKEARA